MSISLDSLRRISARLGGNPDLIQAGGGNTSVKLDGTLWIKASGKWLINAAHEDMFLPVPLDEIHAAMDREQDYTTEYRGLRPSVETTMHAAIPHRCVIHVHSVNTLAWAALGDAPACFADRLEGLRWAWIPYVHPGVTLARRIAGSLGSKPDVIVMQNHGLIVGGEDPESAEELLHEVERRLSLPVRPAPEQTLGVVPGWIPAENDEVHGLGTDPDACRNASSGTLYPDHCVYLGHAAAVKHPREPAEAAASRYQEKWGRRPPVLLCEGAGVVTAPDLSRAGREMLVCLSRVVRRIPADAPVHYLDYSDVARLMNWDAEHYRQAIAKQMDSTPTRL